MLPHYSVIIPVCHGGVFLQRAAASLNRLKAPADGFEILIVGEAAELDAVESIPRELDTIRIIRHSGNRSSALNEACAAAKGNILVFADDDCVFPDDWLLRIEEALGRHPEADVIGGSDRLPENAGLFDQALDHALNSIAATGGIRKDAGLGAGQYYPKLWNMVVRAQAGRLAARPEGLFDTNLHVHEDVDLVERIRQNDGKVLYVPDIVVGHYRDTNLRSFVLRNMHMARVCRKKGIHTRAHLALALFFGTMLVSAGAATFLYPASLTLKLLFGGYAALLAASGLDAARNSRRPALLFAVPGLIFALHAARATGYVSGSVDDTRT
jgi:GT2 family glycosyltransferase